MNYTEEAKYPIPDTGTINWGAILNSIFISLDAGREISLKAGENIAKYDCVYIKSDGKIWKAKADAASTLPAIGVCPLAIDLETTGKVRLNGWLFDDSWSLRVGGLIYVSASTAGLWTQTEPLSGNKSQIIGIAKSSKKILIVNNLKYFDIS